MGELFRQLGPLAPWIVFTTFVTVIAIGASRFWRPLRPFGCFLAFAPLVISMVSQQLAIQEAIATCHALAIFNLEIMDELFKPVGRPDKFGASLTIFCLLLNWIIGKGVGPRSA